MCFICDSREKLYPSGDGFQHATNHIHADNSGSGGSSGNISSYVNDLATNYYWTTGHDNVSSSNGKLQVTYSFNAATQNMDNEGQGAIEITSMSAQQQAGALMAMSEFSSVINVDFIQSTNSDAAAIKFFTADLPTYDSQYGTAGWAWYSWYTGSDVLIDNHDVYQTGYTAGSFNFRLMMHEIGHAMGLSHPGDEGSNAAYDTDGTIMSYNSGEYATRGGDTAPHSLQIYDIAALQSVYGANTSYNAGNDGYSFNGSKIRETIWDGNGVDTYISAAYSGNSLIDLREGVDNMTMVGDSIIWTAFGANIENAISGIGDDTIYGNSLSNIIDGGYGSDVINGDAGADIIIGNFGNDSLSGGSGGDIFRFDDNGFGFDTITDFSDGDRIEFTDILQVDEFSDISSNINVVGGSTLVSLGAMGMIVLQGYTGTLDSGDFIFT